MRWILPLFLLGACGAAGETPDAAPTSSTVGEVPAFEQRAGDPAAGYGALVNESYVSCGVPWVVYEQFFEPAPEWLRLPGRTGRNETLPYDQTALTTARGVEVVTANCLACHAGFMNGELIVGLGAADGDFTSDPSGPAFFAGQLLDEGTPEHDEWQRWYDRLLAVGPYTVTATVGVNPADNLAAVLFAHHDRETFAWSNDPILELPPQIVVPVDVPPWWRMEKKHAMFYSGAGRGDHARIMTASSLLCTDDVAEVEHIDTYFPDVAAYLRSIDPPAYPWTIDDTLAERGREVFDDACASCHGTYGADRASSADDEYPNLIVSLDEVGTDATLALGASQFADRFVLWFNESWFGERAWLAPAPGYYAPPLDGIWATAPYLHNGSVPTIASLLDSSTRPRYWTRTFDSSDYDPDALGWRFTVVDHGQADEPTMSLRKRIYDTSLLGYSNDGHTFGDELTVDDRRALIEYLKTL